MSAKEIVTLQNGIDRRTTGSQVKADPKSQICRKTTRDEVDAVRRLLQFEGTARGLSGIVKNQEKPIAPGVREADIGAITIDHLRKTPENEFNE